MVLGKDWMVLLQHQSQLDSVIETNEHIVIQIKNAAVNGSLYQIL